MNFVFEIAGRLCTADHVRMCGNTIEAEFDHDVTGALADALDRSDKVSVPSIPSLSVTYSVQEFWPDGHGGCHATFSVNSSAGQVLH